MAQPLFELKGVYFSYLGRIPALCGVDLNVDAGTKVGIIGANGSGKSTLLNMLDALIFPDKGTLTAFGRELKEDAFYDVDFSRRFRRKVGFVFQNPDVQLFCPTVREDIVFGPLQLGETPGEVRKRLEAVVPELKIRSLLERPSCQLSIGEKKKVAIASVLMIDPQVLLLDEPTAGLDPQTTRDIIDILLSAHETGKTLVIATHDLHIVEELADVVHVFGAEKNIVRSGAPSSLLADQDFLSKNNLVHIHRHRHVGETHAHPHLHLDHNTDHHA